MTVRTIASLKSSMPVGVAGGTSVQDIHDIVDTFDDTCTTLGSRVTTLESSGGGGGAPAVTNIKSYGALGNNTGNDSAAFASASVASRFVYVPEGTYRITGTATITENTKIYGPGRIHFVSGSFVCNSDVTIEGLTFTSEETYTGQMIQTVSASTWRTSRRLRVLNCKFTLPSTTIEGTAVYISQNNADCEVNGCYATGGDALVRHFGGCYNRITNNTCDDCFHAIYCLGSSYCVVSNNVIRSTLQKAWTGILFMSDRANLSPRANCIVGNIIANNSIDDIPEEGISIDCRGNEPASWPENSVNPIVTLSSTVDTDAQTRRYNISQTGQSAGWATEFYAIALNGPAVGSANRIIDSGSGYFVLERGNDTGGNAENAVAGNMFLISSATLHNVMIGNTVRRCGRQGLGYYGSAWHNTMVGNTVVGCGRGCVVWSVASANLTNCQSLSGFNLVEGNTITMDGAQTTNTGQRVAREFAIYLYTQNTDGANTYYNTTLFNPGNIVRNNVINSRRGIRAIKTDWSVIDGNRIIGGGQIELIGCKDSHVGSNWIGNTRTSATNTVTEFTYNWVDNTTTTGTQYF